MGNFALTGALDSHATLIVEALDRLDTIVLILAPPEPPATLPRVLAANTAFERMVGAKAAAAARIDAEGLGRFTLPTTLPATLIAMTRAVEDGTKLFGEVQLAGQGGPFWLGFSLTTVSVPASPTRCVLIGRNISDQVRRGGEDQATQRLLARAFASIEAPVAVVTATDRVVTASRRFSEMCGRSAKQLTGSSLSGILDAEVRAQVQAILTNSAPGAPPTEFHGGGTHHDGTPFAASFNVSVIEGRGTELLAVLTLHQNAAPTDAALVLEAATEDAEAAPEALGTIRLVGLTEFKSALGTEWLKVAERAMIIAEATIRRRLPFQDVLSRTTDQEFLIWFHHGNAEENAIVAARIARDVRIALMTEFADAMVSSVASATVTLPQGSAPRQLAAASSAALDRHPGLQPNPDLEAARAYLAWAEKELPVDIEQIYGRGGQPLSAVWCSLPGSVEARLKGAAASLSGETFGALELDMLRLRAGLAVAAKAAARNMPRSCLVPLACTCLVAPRAREMMMEILGSIEAQTASRLTLLLSGDLAQFRPARLQELVAPLRGRVRAVGLAVGAIADLPPGLLKKPFSVISFSPGGFKGEAYEAALWEVIESIHRAGSKVIARQVGTPTDARNFLELGVDFVCGTAPASPLG